MGFDGSVELVYGQEKKIYSANRNNRALGTRGKLPDGRVFRWSLNSTAALIANEAVQTMANPSTSVHMHSLTPNANTSGVTTLSVTWATTPVVVNKYTDGYMLVDTAPGLSGLYRVKSNVAATSATAGQVVLDDNDPLTVALTTVSKVGFITNEYSSVVQSPIKGSATGRVIGITPVAVTASYYFWLQTYGLTSALAQGALVSGMPVVRPMTTPGAVEAGWNSSVAPTTATSSSLDVQVIGYAQNIGAGDGKRSFVFLTIAA